MKNNNAAPKTKVTAVMTTRINNQTGEGALHVGSSTPLDDVDEYDYGTSCMYGCGLG